MSRRSPLASYVRALLWPSATLLPFTANGADVPAEVKASLTDQPADVMAASPDGRIIVAVDQYEVLVRYFDGWRTAAYEAGDDSNVIDLYDECTYPLGAFVSQETSSGYLVNVLCTDYFLEESQLVQFWIAPDDGAASDTAGQLIAGAPETHPYAPLFYLTAAAIDPSGSTLYLAHWDSAALVSTLYTVSATELQGAFAEYASITYSNWGIERMAYNADGDTLVTVDLNGLVFIASDGATLADTPQTCTWPREVLPLSDTTTLVLGYEPEVYVLSVEAGVATSCTARDWGFSYGPTALARLTVDGAGDAVDRLYVRAENDESDNVLIYDTEQVLTDPAAATPVQSFVADVFGDYDDLVATSLSRVYLGTAYGVTELSAAPFLTVTTAAEPVTVSEDAPSISATLLSDEDATAAWFDTVPPFESASTDATSLGTLTGGSDTAIEIDTSVLESLATGINTLFLYATDPDGNLGWTTLSVLKEAVEDDTGDDTDITEFEIDAGAAFITLTFKKPSSEAIMDYELLMAESSFTAPEDGEDLPTEWDTEGAPAFTADDTTYPVGGSWPMSLSYGDSSSSWTEEDGYLTYTLEPLENGTTYYIALRAVTADSVGSWTDVVYAAPTEESCDASCITDGAGGFCSIAPLSEDPHGRRWRFPGLTVALPAVWLLFLRRRSASSLR